MDQGRKRKRNAQMPQSSDSEIKQKAKLTCNKTKQSKPNLIIKTEVQDGHDSTTSQNVQNCQPESSSTQVNYKSFAIGIDLGTSNIRVGVVRNGKFEIIPNEEGNLSTPSCVAFADSQRLIEDAAKQQIVANSRNTVNSIKRLIGRTFEDPLLERELYSIGFEVINDDNKPKIKIQHKKKTQTFCPEEILSMVLRKLKLDAEKYLGQSVTNAVVAVPADFTYHQRQAVKDGSAIAHLNVLRIVNDSTIAALAYGFDKKKSSKEINVLIFDMGSHNCNVSIVTIADGVYEVKGTASAKTFSKTYAAGSSLDTRLVQYFVKEFEQKHSQKDLSTNKRSLVRLRTACEQVKMELSRKNEAKIDIDSLFDGIDFHSSITRVQFEDICADLFRRTIDKVSSCRGYDQIHEVVPIGGSIRIPKICSLLESLIDRGKKLNTSIKPDEAVVCGAAFQALPEILLLERTSLSYGVK